MAIIYVTSAADGPAAADGVTTLREAIAQANADAGTDTILFQIAQMGTSTIRLTAGELLVTSDLVINGGVDLTVSGNDASRILHVTGSGTDLELSQLILTNGRTTGTEESGGAILAEAGTVLTLQSSTVTASSTQGDESFGGGIAAFGTVAILDSSISGNATSGNYAQGGGVWGLNLTISNSTVTGNSTAGTQSHGAGAASSGSLTIEDGAIVSANLAHGRYARGGGAYSEGPLLVTGSSILANGTTGFQGHGGGLYALSQVTLARGAVSRNYTSGDQADGAGIYAPSVTVTESTLDANLLRGNDSHGGGLHVRDQLTVVRSTLSNNEAAGAGTFGGAAYVVGAATITSSTIADNTNSAIAQGGAGIVGGALAFQASTITGNTSLGTSDGYGGAGIRATGAITLSNTIVAGNSAVAGNPDIVGTITSSDGHNVFGTAPAGTVSGDVVNVPAARLFAGGLDDYGGPTLTVALLDQANNPALFHGAGGPGNDQRDDPRPGTAGAQPDAGAFELQKSSPVALGSVRADSLVGSAADEVLRGLGGADRLHGRGGGDRLEGGGGADRIVGGLGGDVLVGGHGADAFVFRAAGHSRPDDRDLIVDFSRRQGDVIDLRALAAGHRESDGHALDFIGRGAFEEAGEVRYRVGQGHTVVEVNLDGDAQAELSFRLGTLVHLTERDFLL